MSTDRPPHNPTMFTLRIWQEGVAKGEQEWRGRVQRLPDGDVHYFRGWPALIAFLEREVPSRESRPAQSEEA